MSFFKPAKAPMTGSDLSHITRGLHEAAAATNQLIAQQYIKLFSQFFDGDPENPAVPMRAKMVEVAVDADHTMQIPMIALVTPRGLSLEAMNVDLSVRIKACEVEQAQRELENGEAHYERFSVTLGADKRNSQDRDPNEVQISLKFEARQPPEALNRLIEEYTQLISPVRTRPLDPEPSADAG
ncbi:DUF2589 domain-containing protein [Pseudomonas sp. nanlin1]|uniref:DUF2589 domain-containing protein n=1 Tax=Pseudomonas sp. nanlin1 TaxID=3040605 RepID=UPI00388EE982